MKKILSVLLTIALLASLVPGAAYALTADYQKVISFNNMPTNYIPAEEVTLGEATAVYVAETQAGADKALKLALKKSSNSVTFKGDATGNTVTYSVDLKMDKDLTATIALVPGGGTAVNVINIGADGMAKMTSGPSLNFKITDNEFRNLKIVANPVTKRVSFYAGSRACLKNIYLSTMPPSLSGIKITATESYGVKSSLYVDNFVAASGTVENISIPKTTYNTETLDAVVEPGDEVVEEVVGDYVFINSNFDTDSSLSGTQMGIPQDGRMERVDDKRRGNGYIVAQQGTGTGRLDVLMDATRYMVLEVDLSYEKLGFSGQLFQIGVSSTYSYLCKLTTSGQVTTYTGNRVVCTLQKNKWTTVSAVCDLDAQTFDIYADGKLVYKDVAISSPQKKYFTRLRALSLATGSGVLYLDNLKAYEGKEIRSLSADSTQKVEASIVPDGTEATSILGTNTVISLKSGSVYDGSKKIRSDVIPYEKDDEIYVPSDAAAALLGASVSYDASAGLSLNGQKVTTVSPVEQKDGNVFLPIIYIAEKVLNKTVTKNGRGFCIISDAPVTYTESELIKINNYILYDRPEPEEILSLFNEKMAGVHPRVLITNDDIERIKYNYKTKDYYKEWVDKLIAAADRELAMPIYGFNYEADTYESGARRGIRDRIIYFGIAYFMTGDLKYPQRAYNELASAAAFPHWVNEKEYLDTAEMMISFAIGYDWFFDVWTDTQKKFLADTVMDKGLRHSRDIFYGVGRGVSTWWADNDTNWSACCNNGTFEAAIALMDEYPELCSDMVSKTIRSVEKMLKEFYPSGAWYEGISYHSYILEHMSMMISSAMNCFGTDFELLSTPSLDITGNYVVALSGPVASNNFHDSSEGRQLFPTLTWLSNVYSNPVYAAERLNGLRFYGLGVHFYDVIYWPKDFDETIRASLPKDVSFKATELVVLRSEYSNPEATYLSYHAGDVVAQHSHVDAGSFVMDMNGVRWASDLGADDYNADGYFDVYGKRNNYYRVRAEGHNCVVIDPDESAGQDLYAFIPIESLTTASGNGFSTVDMTPAYKTSCESYRRGFMLGENRRAITVRDEFKFLDGKHEVYWFMHTRSDIELIDEKTAILTQKGKRLKAQLVTDIEGAVFSVMEAKPLPTSPNPAQLGNGKVVKLTVHATDVRDTGYIQVRFTDADDEISNLEAKDVAIADWKEDHTPFTTRPVLSDIKADGVTLDGFNSKITSYLVPVSYRTKYMPEITATADDDCVVEITKAENVDDVTTIKVYRKDNPTDSRSYAITYQLQITAEDKEYVPVAVTASRAPQLENPAKNAVDGNLSTRWSADGEGEWLMLEFAEKVPVKLIRVAAMNATSRKTKFDIEVSDDGVNWTKIIEHETDGITPGYEYMECDAAGKYVRLYGYGNSVNEWNSILEFNVIDTRDW